MAGKKRITIVNDSPEFLNLMVEFLSDEGYDVIAFPKHQGAYEQIKATMPDIVMCDLIFGTLPAGWAVIDMLYLDPQTRVIPLIVCSAATKEMQEMAPSLAAKGIVWVEKPFELERLLEILTAIHDTAEVKAAASSAKVLRKPPQ